MIDLCFLVSVTKVDRLRTNRNVDERDDVTY